MVAIAIKRRLEHRAHALLVPDLVCGEHLAGEPFPLPHLLYCGLRVGERYDPGERYRAEVRVLTFNPALEAVAGLRSLLERAAVIHGVPAQIPG